MATTSVEQNDPLSWRQWKAEIVRRLNLARPTRYGREDRDWMEPTKGWARLRMPDETNLVRVYAERIVNSIEANATRTGNRLMHAWNNGQRPLVWDEYGAFPVTIDDLRVRLDAATSDDMRDWATEREGEAKRNYDAELSLARAARDLADLAAARGLERIRELGDLAPRGEDGAIVPWTPDDDFGNPDFDPYEDYE